MRVVAIALLRVAAVTGLLFGLGRFSQIVVKHACVKYAASANFWFHQGGLDPWQRPWRVPVSSKPWAYSVGPNGVDEGGSAQSDDFAPLDWSPLGMLPLLFLDTLLASVAFSVGVATEWRRLGLEGRRGTFSMIILSQIATMPLCAVVSRAMHADLAISLSSWRAWLPWVSSDRAATISIQGASFLVFVLCWVRRPRPVSRQ